MRTSFCSHLVALLLLSLASGNGSAQPTGAVPTACMTYHLVSGVKTSFGVPLLELPVLTGIASTVTSNTISVTNVSWTQDQFATGAVYFVTIRTGAQAGRTLRVTGNNADTLTLDIEDTPLNTAGFTVAAGTDTIELFQGDTLSTLFGSTADASGKLSSGLIGGTGASTADNVQLYDGTGFVTYFFNTTSGHWAKSGGGSTNQNGLVLFPDDGMLILRRGATVDLNFLGRVPATRLLTKFPGGTTSVVSIRFPADTTLGTLNFGAPGTWITASSASAADNVAIWSGSKWDNYFKNTSNLWVKASGNSTDQSATVVKAGSAIRVIKRGTATGAAAYLGQSLPYGF